MAIQDGFISIAMVIQGLVDELESRGGGDRHAERGEGAGEIVAGPAFRCIYRQLRDKDGAKAYQAPDDGACLPGVVLHHLVNAMAGISCTSYPHFNFPP